MDRIEELFVPQTVTTVEDLMDFIRQEILRRGGDPATVKMLDTDSAIPNVKHSDEWPCWTLQFDYAEQRKPRSPAMNLNRRRRSLSTFWMNGGRDERRT
jgi:hypothetical protein